jgi:signal transduction histidine kinase
MLACTPEVKQATYDYQYEETRELVAFVNDAAAAVEKKGTQVFPQFRNKDGKWVKDDMYIFVWGLNGMRYVYPPNPAGEGKNMLDLIDVNGKPIGRMFVEAVTQNGPSGWVHYQWPKIDGARPLWKSTYLVKTTSPAGKKYLVGSGLYNMRMEEKFIVNEVNKAAELLKTEGLVATKTLGDRSSEFIFLDTYVFVIDQAGVEIFNPMFPELEGKNVLKLQDENGKYMIKELFEKLETQKTAWTEYMWPKPAEKIASAKKVFMKKIEINDDIFYVASGYYPETGKENL